MHAMKIIANNLPPNLDVGHNNYVVDVMAAMSTSCIEPFTLPQYSTFIVTA
jgi:hypothetical protein